MPAKGHQSPRASREKWHLGHALQLELDDRGWDRRRFGKEADLPLTIINGLLAGGLVTSLAAARIARALGGSADLWLEADAEIREQRSKGQPW